MEALPQIVAKGDAQALTAAIARLQDTDRFVRLAAVHALSQIAVKGDARAVTAVISSLEDSERSIREAAVEVLLQIVLKIRLEPIFKTRGP